MNNTTWIEHQANCKCGWHVVGEDLKAVEVSADAHETRHMLRARFHETTVVTVDRGKGR